MHHRDEYSQRSSTIWLVWLNDLVLVYELSGCEFKSRSSHIIFLTFGSSSFIDTGPVSFRISTKLYLTQLLVAGHKLNILTLHNTRSAKSLVALTNSNKFLKELTRDSRI